MSGTQQKEIDPEIEQYILDNPDVKYSEFKKKFPDVSYWIFRRKNKKESRILSISSEDIAKKLVPNSKNLTVYISIIDMLKKNENTSFGDIKLIYEELGVSDATFYKFRKDYKKFIATSVKLDEEKSVRSKRRNNRLFTVLYDKEISEIEKQKPRELLEGFIQTLIDRKMADLEVVEIISPRHVLEIRSYR